MAGFDEAIEKLIEYLESDQNLYPQAETELVELLCALQHDKLSLTSQVKIQDIAYRMVTGKGERKLEAQSEYSRGMAVYLLYKADKTKNDEITDMYLSNTSYTEYFKKCLAIVALTISNHTKVQKVQSKLRSDTAPEMKRLLNLVEGMDKHVNSSSIKKYRKGNRFFVYRDDYKDTKGKTVEKEITLEHLPIRLEVLEDLIAKWAA